MRKKSKMIWRKNQERQIALERIAILKRLIKENPESKYNKRYADLIERISKKYRLFNYKALRKKKYKAWRR